MLGNLLAAAGFQVVKVDSVIGAYPPNYMELKEKLSKEEWEKAVFEYGQKVHMMHVNALGVRVE